ncbi:MAG: glutathione S-transferase [Gammaproteobacteria bacterium]|nr:glutathione S-transferase [Gammaproteobacteria bacterium]
MAPNPRGARIFIAEKGLIIPTQEINILAGENLTPAYLRINPWGLLPALALDDGTVITQTPCICRYLETLHPAPNLLGRDALETARIGAWERCSEMNGQNAIAEFCRNQCAPLASRAVPGFAGVKALPELVARGRQRAAWYDEQMENQLATSAYVAGPRYTAADSTAQCAMDFANAVGLPVPAGHQHTLRWLQNLSTRPSATA